MTRIPWPGPEPNRPLSTLHSPQKSDSFIKLRDDKLSPLFLTTHHVFYLSAEEIHAVFATNVYGAVAVTRAVLPHMRARRQGTIANLGSIGGWIGTPVAGFYCATKAALTSITEALRVEVAAFGINVTAIEPGYFRTGFLNQGHQVVGKGKEKVEGMGELVEGVRGKLGSLGGQQPGDPKKGAKVVVEALTGSGRCEGRVLPPRLALGRDAVGYIAGVMNANRKTLDEWKDVVSTTDHDDVN